MKNINLIKPKFIHLHIHTDYSIIDGLIQIKKLINKAYKNNIPALAITDFTNFFSLIKFYNFAIKSGIKPIIGVDFLITNNNIIYNNLTELTILAKNNIGYQNLINLISIAYKKSYKKYNHLFIIYKWLKIYNKGLIILSGAQNGDLGKSLIKKDIKYAEKIIFFYKKYFYNRFYIELVRIKNINEEEYINYAIDFSIKHQIPLVATNNVRFIEKKDFKAHEIRVAINKGYILNNNKKYLSNYTKFQYLRSEQEMCKLFSDIPEALQNTVEISKICNVTIQLGKYHLPQFNTNKIPISKYLINCAKKGLEERLNIIFPNKINKKNKRYIYDNRLIKELNIIIKIGFASYFLIVMEFIQWAKNNNIPVGPGRGSGAGSLVAYVLKITEIDPLKFDLIFERFINEGRLSMPDFDIDFCINKRDLVIKHVCKKYGKNSVTQIITFGTMAAKAAIKDVGRVLGYPFNFINNISKLIPTDIGMTIKKAFTENIQLKLLYKNNDDIKYLINMSKKLEGIIRNTSTHAGGVIISPEKITKYSPIYYDYNKQNFITQFDKNDIEKIGLVKFDFLGLKTLTTIKNCIDMVNYNLKNKNIPTININKIPLNDKKSFNILKKAKTNAIFQLESTGIKELIKKLQPDCFEDIIALIALFRPGPLKSGMVENFIKRKHGKEKISYPDSKWQHKLLKPILLSTYGIILYQEQIIKIAQVLAGYTLNKADILRIAMGKKQPKEMIKQKNLFINSANNMGINKFLSMKIFNIVEKFAGYGFNKSHSTAYALISYQTMWLKSNFPEYYMASVMTSEIDNTKKIISLIKECINMKLKILPPNINTGKYNFYVNKYNEIEYGIGAIKGIGKISIKNIIKYRNKNKFKNIFDLCIRSKLTKTNKKILEKLIMSGALDSIDNNRSLLINKIDIALKLSEQYNNYTNYKQIDLFNNSFNKIKKINLKNNNIIKLSKKKILKEEKKTLGFYITGNPIDEYLIKIKKNINIIRIKDIYNYNNININTIGLISYIKIKNTSNNNQICICILNDNLYTLEIILFNKILIQYKKLLKINNIIILNGKIIFDKYVQKKKIYVKNIIYIKKYF